MTYPDPSLSELLPKFVLVKVDHDAEPALVKQYAVTSLPDVRLLAPDGKELDKMIGPTGAAKLARRLGAALERLAGREPESDEDATNRQSTASAATPVEVTPDSIGLAILHGVSFLRREWRKGWSAPPRFAPDDVVLYTWSSCGLARSDADVAALTTRLLDAPPSGTYRAALRACAFERLGGDDLRPSIEACARFLESTQLANGEWTYGPPEGASARPPTLGDHSNTAYALLGLAACERAGVSVSHAVLERATTRWLATQNEDGGFGYRADRESASYASMTASGLHCLLLAQRSSVALPNAIARGGDWLSKHFSPSENVGSAVQDGRRLYGLFAIERVGDFDTATTTRSRALPENWYREGAKHLLSMQHDDGSWDDGAQTTIPDSCFALLFLARASASKRP